MEMAIVSAFSRIPESVGFPLMIGGIIGGLVIVATIILYIFR